ncbi:MAG: isopeptide-forming domain-containing fimbrial protein [Ruminococcus sp.]|nr:isopeptide-forming domain-containing fimbrial protein [Ruminococcus sp.]
MIAALTLSACSIAPMAMTASAASVTEGDGNSITITNADEAGLSHTKMAAYQIFKGEYDEEQDQLGVSGWGDGINVKDFIEALQSNDAFNATPGDNSSNAFAGIEAKDTALTAQQVSDIVGKWSSNSAQAEAFAKLAVANNSGTTSGEFNEAVTSVSKLPDGYYVIADEEAATAGTNGEDGSAFTLGLLAVAGGSNVTASPKTDFPTVVKKVLEDDITTDDGYGAGYNDVADWDINTPVPFKIIGSVPSNIDKYEHYYMEFSDEMDNSFDPIESLKVEVDGTELTSTQYTVTAGENAEDANDFKVIITDLKGLGLTITEDTQVTVTYTAKINVANAVIGLDGQENFVDLTYSNNPNKTGNGKDKPENTGKTPKDKVIVFTYETDVNKIDGNTNEPIENAEFKLANADGTKWAIVDANGKFTEWVDSADAATTLKTDADGMIKVIGLDDGSYQLKELKWSDEYNIPEEAFSVVLDATTEFTQDSYGTASDVLTEIKGTVGGENADVLYKTVNDEQKMIGIEGQIENKKGTALPSTGGIGTTIFYLGGGAMVAVAGVFLITKKRMGKSEN